MKLKLNLLTSLIIILVVTLTVLVPSCKLAQVISKPAPVEYNIGTGIAKVTDPAIGLGMQGMSDDNQKTAGVESDLYARTFIIHHIGTNKRVLLLNADIWSCTHSIKTEVIKRLQSEFGNLYNDENVLLSGTHNHSGPGGYNYYYLYNHSMRGFDAHNFECIVSGMVTAIRKAHNNLAPGRIYMQSGEIADCGRNRSAEAYNNNPQQERDQHQNNTDKEMILLKFVKVVDSTTEKPAGILSWYGVHPTDRGQKNTMVNGDNKGYASYLFENDMDTNTKVQKPFVAAFANSIAGDVSGNVEYGQIPDGTNDIAHMKTHGRKQYAAAKDLYLNAVTNLTLVSGPIDFRYQYVDMVAKTGAPGCLGLSMFAGSTEDSDPGSGLKEGIVEGSVLVTERTAQAVIGMGFGLASGVPYAKLVDLSSSEVDIQLPKPITLIPGYTGNGMVPLTPTILPIQIIKIGNLAIVGFPGELTTMAGRRLRTAVFNELNGSGINKVAINTYANDYSQYTATNEEYQKQHYEGASTLFGPKALDTYITEYTSLANAIKAGSSVALGTMPPDLSASCKKIQRITIRNETADNKALSFYNINDTDMLVSRSSAPNTIPGNADLFFNVEGLPGGKDVKIVVNNNKQNVVSVHYGQLLRILPDGSLQVTAYVPPPR